ncbi:MFS transporter [Geomicrobium sp. JCM 19038]|uniref:MFS transporter n=1 Tax=Geomicrobium sp. JCM 19038 TaxID=1460635 RepID=UPI00045F3744|nr:MFS transporter [Geomicrobium sp. JCM 19038]GAK07824.1 permease [Geomicrobium sp. JCM 19038]
MTYIQSGTKTYYAAAIALFFAGFVTFATIYATQPLLPIFSNEFGVTAQSASLTISVTTGMLAILLLVAAPLSDRFGRKNVMVLSMILTAVMGLLTAFSPNFGTLLSIRTFLGIAVAGVPAIAMTYVVEEFDQNSLGKVMGLYIAGSSIGGMSGRLITGVLTDIWNWQVALTALGGLSLLMSVLFVLMLPKSKHYKPKELSVNQALRRYGSVLKQPQLMAVISLGFILMGSFIVLFNYFAYLLMEPPFSLSQAIIGFIYIVYLAGTFSSVYMGKKADRHGKPTVIFLGIGLMTVGALLTLVPMLLVTILGVVIFTFGFFGAHSTASAWVSQRAKEYRSQASSLYLFAYYAGSSIAGAIGGFFYTSFAWLGVVVFMLGLLALAVPAIQYAKKERAEEL